MILPCKINIVAELLARPHDLSLLAAGAFSAVYRTSVCGHCSDQGRRPGA